MTSPALSVSTRFTQFLGNLALTDAQRDDGSIKHSGVRRVLNEHYWNLSSGSANSMLVGSWGKSTEVRPPRDIDVLFTLPNRVYERFQAVPWPRNKQSELLQEVKRVIAATYGSTTIRGDGQVVVAGFTSYAVEVVPAFDVGGGRYWICDTNNGGSYKTIAPDAEQQAVRSSNDRTKGNTRALIRIMKAWQRCCSVPVKSFWLELLAVDFLNSWGHAGQTALYYDWMVRDFLAYLVRRANGLVFVPGTLEPIALGDAWKSRAETAHARALKACAATSEIEAGIEWQKIFGDQMPVWP
jgi:hypothetical protein